MKRFSIFAVLFCLAVCAGCGTDDGGAVPAAGNGDQDAGGNGGACAVEPTFSSIYAQIIQPSCAFSSCHGAQGSSGSGDLRLDEGAAAALTALLARTDDPSARGDFPNRVVPGDRARSFLYEQLETGRMPIGPRLEDCQVEAVGVWIDSGAGE